MAPTPARMLWWVLLSVAVALLQASQQRPSSGRPPLFMIQISSKALQQWTQSSSATAKRLWRKAMQVFTQQEELDMATMLDSWTSGSADDSEDEEYGCLSVLSNARYKEICVVSK